MTVSARRWISRSFFIRYLISSAMVTILIPCCSENFKTRSGMRANGAVVFHDLADRPRVSARPAGTNEPSLRSDPARTSTPPSANDREDMARFDQVFRLGLLGNRGLDGFGPVKRADARGTFLPRASMETQKAVPNRLWFSVTMSGKSSWWRRSSVMVRQTRPDQKSP